MTKFNLVDFGISRITLHHLQGPLFSKGTVTTQLRQNKLGPKGKDEVRFQGQEINK